jgi:hypothetical protein
MIKRHVLGTTAPDLSRICRKLQEIAAKEQAEAPKS